MPTLLVIESSPRGDQSMSRGLTKMFIESWLKSNPDGHIIERDLIKSNLTFVSMPWLGAYFTPSEHHTIEMKNILKLSDDLVNEILTSDHIVIGTPVYNYNVPAVLKAYIDHIVRKGLTLGFSGEGLVHGKKCTILMASGGVYTKDSPIHDRDIATNYLKLILKVIGIEDVRVIAGGNAKSVDMGQTTQEKFLQTFTLKVSDAASRY
jgi:FMN-dependent NADH-azoreductase